MRVLLRAIACAWVLAQTLAAQGAAAQDNPVSYASFFNAPKVLQVLHCPYCNGSVRVVAGSIYVVRTAEGLKLPFDDAAAANRAVELLNWMAFAADQCQRAEYRFAKGEYTSLIASEPAPKNAELEATGVFSLLNPMQALLPLTQYALPPIHRCEIRRAIAARLGPGRRHQSGLRVWRRHAQIILTRKYAVPLR
jgi:hypothetical protein